MFKKITKMSPLKVAALGAAVSVSSLLVLARVGPSYDIAESRLRSPSHMELIKRETEGVKRFLKEVERDIEEGKYEQGEIVASKVIPKIGEIRSNTSINSVLTTSESLILWTSSILFDAGILTSMFGFIAYSENRKQSNPKIQLQKQTSTKP